MPTSTSRSTPPTSMSRARPCRNAASTTTRVVSQVSRLAWSCKTDEDVRLISTRLPSTPQATARSSWRRAGWHGLYPAEDLRATGAIGWRPVRCLSPQLQLRFRLGYEWSERDVHNVRLLVERFGVPAPPPFRQQGLNSDTAREGAAATVRSW